MQVDRFFKQLERRSERDLYRKASRAVFTSQRNLLNKATFDKKLFKNKRIALEFLWFFSALLIGFLFGYILYIIIESIADPILFDSFVQLMGGEVANFFYLLTGFCFLGVYVSRIVTWALKQI